MPATLKRKRHLRTNGATPLNRAARGDDARHIAYARETDAKPPEPERRPQGPPPDTTPLQGYVGRQKEQLASGREHFFAYAMAGRFDRWLLLHVAACGIPMDSVTGPSPWRNGQQRPWEPGPGERELLHLLVEAWLLALRAWPGSRDVACLPGCGGDNGEGGPCPNLRRFGSRLCDDCADDERRAERGYTVADAIEMGLTVR